MFKLMNELYQLDQYQNPTSGNGVLVDQRVQGFVKWYNFKNGFGFVTR